MLRLTRKRNLILSIYDIWKKEFYFIFDTILVFFLLFINTKIFNFFCKYPNFSKNFKFDKEYSLKYWFCYIGFISLEILIIFTIIFILGLICCVVTRILVANKMCFLPLTKEELEQNEIYSLADWFYFIFNYILVFDICKITINSTNNEKIVYKILEYTKRYIITDNVLPINEKDICFYKEITTYEFCKFFSNLCIHKTLTKDDFVKHFNDFLNYTITIDTNLMMEKE